ncbi:MAG: hypothetical protein AAGJ37_00725 [Pseudomonadota bacterium]
MRLNVAAELTNVAAMKCANVAIAAKMQIAAIIKTVVERCSTQRFTGNRSLDTRAN